MTKVPPTTKAPARAGAFVRPGVIRDLIALRGREERGERDRFPETTKRGNRVRNYAALRRRRAANKVARASRKANR